MILVRLAGGLGNQLFQTMAALLIARRQDQPVLLLTEGLQRYAQARRPDVLRLLSSPWLLNSQDTKPLAMLNWAAIQLRAGRWVPYWGFSDTAFPSGLARQRRHSILDGYFQRGWTDAMLDDALGAMRLVPLAAPVGNAGHGGFDCVLHVRGGDFLGLEQYAFLDENYYRQGVARALEEGCRRFGLVTDDSAHAQRTADTLARLYAGAEFVVLPPASDPLVDFETLRSARCRIIGNSTFAWWASAMGARDAITWSPDRFTKAQRRDYFLPGERRVTESAVGVPAARGES